MNKDSSFQATEEPKKRTNKKNKKPNMQKIRLLEVGIVKKSKGHFMGGYGDIVFHDFYRKFIESFHPINWDGI